MINEIRNFISECPCLSGRLININHLNSRVGSLSLDTAVSDRIIREYADGERLCSSRFTLSARESFSQSISENHSAVQLFDEFAAWLASQSRQGNLPRLEGSRTAIELVPTGSCTLKGVSGATARYETTFEVCYHQQL